MLSLRRIARAFDFSSPHNRVLKALKDNDVGSLVSALDTYCQYNDRTRIPDRATKLKEVGAALLAKGYKSFDDMDKSGLEAMPPTIGGIQQQAKDGSAAFTSRDVAGLLIGQVIVSFAEGRNAHPNSVGYIADAYAYLAAHEKRRAIPGFQPAHA